MHLSSSCLPTLRLPDAALPLRVALGERLNFRRSTLGAAFEISVMHINADFGNMLLGEELCIEVAGLSDARKLMDLRLIERKAVGVARAPSPV